jgi:UDP-N-acetylglucosamine 2-epimerase (non-hydrolysing)
VAESFETTAGESSEERSVSKIMTVFGTRPEAIKVAPVLAALARAGSGFECINVISSQHKELLWPFLKLFRVEVHHDLDVMSQAQTPLMVLSRTMDRLTPIIEKERPDLLLVQGDTSTALGAALTAFHAGIPVGHIEAGLRTGNPRSPFPEEMNRRLISQMAELNFAATEHNQRILLDEKIDPRTIHVTGNPVVDALLMIRSSTTLAPAIEKRLEPWRGHKLILLTTHRRESFGETMNRNLQELAGFVARHPEVVLVFPVHPNPKVRSAVDAVLKGHERVELLDPLDYPDFLHLLERSWLIVSDSGGVQEEAPSFGRPLLVLRENTERPEGLAAGTSKLVGGDPLELRRMLEEAHAPGSWAERVGAVVNPFGDGQAARRITEAIATYFAAAGKPPVRG